MKTNIEKKTNLFKIFLQLLYIVSIGVYVYFLVEGLEFYKTAFQQRPYLEQYRLLRPAGLQGQGFGILGSAMMILMLLYSIRKRTQLFGNWGALNHWLDIHIYFGIMGPLWIILHTSFKVHGLIAVSFWSMIAVASSGIIGRYLYCQIPRNRQGEELNMREIDKMERRFNKEIQEELKLNEDEFLRLESLTAAMTSENTNIISLLILMMLKDLLRPWFNYRLKKKYAGEFNFSGKRLDHAVILARQKTVLHQRVLLLDQIQRLFHYWHVFHKPFAVIMFIIMVVHIGVAVWLGYTWIF